MYSAQVSLCEKVTSRTIQWKMKFSTLTMYPPGGVRREDGSLPQSVGWHTVQYSSIVNNVYLYSTCIVSVYCVGDNVQRTYLLAEQHSLYLIFIVRSFTAAPFPPPPLPTGALCMCTLLVLMSVCKLCVPKNTCTVTIWPADTRAEPDYGEVHNLSPPPPQFHQASARLFTITSFPALVY